MERKRRLLDTNLISHCSYSSRPTKKTKYEHDSSTANTVDSEESIRIECARIVEGLINDLEKVLKDKHVSIIYRYLVIHV